VRRIPIGDLAAFRLLHRRASRPPAAPLGDAPAHDPFSPDNQRRLCHEAAKRNGEHIPPEYEFKELDVSGRKNRQRRDLDAALKLLVTGKIKTLYVAKLDRLTRRGMRHVGLILDELEKVGGRIVFVADGLDTSKPGVRPIIAILAEQARAESDNISWRVGQWHMHNRRNRLWNQKRPYGYLVENGRLKPHPAEALIVRRMIDDFLGGASLRSIAHWLNDEGVKPPIVVHSEEAKAMGRRSKTPRFDSWGSTSVRKVLSNPAVAALVSNKRKLVYDEHGAPISAGEGIATLAERARILAELERRSVVVREGTAERIGKRTGGGRPAEHLLVGFVRCAECGAAAVRVLGPHIKGESTHYFRCSKKQSAGRCRGAYIRESHLEDEVVARLRARLSALEPGDPLLDEIAERWFLQKVPDQETDRLVLEEGREAARARIADLYAARYERGEFSTPDELAMYERLMQRLREQRDAAEAALAKLPPRPEFDLAALLDGELSIEAWPTVPVARQRFLLSLAVHQVWVYSVDVPPQDRVILVAHGEQPPEPRRGHEDVPPDDGRLAVLFHHRGSRGTRSVRYCIVHRRGCKRLPYPPGDARWEAAYEGPGRTVLAQPAEVPRLTAGHPVRVCGDCRIESPTKSQAE
jgi:site-specific DNA recombinase